MSMSMFHMVLASPPSRTPVLTIYREQQAFGPYESESGPDFSSGIVLQVAESATEYHNVQTFCQGMLRVIGVQNRFPHDDPDSPLVVSLELLTREIRELGSICREAGIEPPLVMLYTGLDPHRLRERLYSMGVPPDEFGTQPEEWWTKFREGKSSVLVESGFILGKVSLKTVDNGYVTFGLSARTSPLNVENPDSESANYIDPVVLYSELAAACISDGTPAIDPEEAANSWLEVATKNRVLITFRDEWNHPLISPHETVEVRGGTSLVTAPLTFHRQGTLCVPGGWSNYTCRIAGRMLTPIPSDRGASDIVVITAKPPAHLVVCTVRPEDWFHEPYPPLRHKDKELRHEKDGRIVYYTECNKVEPLFDGFQCFSRLVEDLKRVNDPSHFILLGGWWMNHKFQLEPGNPHSTLEHLLTEADNTGATIRGLIFDYFGLKIPDSVPNLIQKYLPWNDVTDEFIDSLSGGESVLDRRTHHFADIMKMGPVPMGGLETLTQKQAMEILFGERDLQTLGSNVLKGIEHFGSHHSKYVVIKNSEGTAAYLGGLDINPNRLDGPDHLPEDSRWHEVHCRVQGPAVADVCKAFSDRWNDHPDHPSILSVAPNTTIPDATCMVQIACTHGAGTLSYAPDGDRTIWATLERAIGRAQKYIYIEDQFLFYDKLSARLLERLDHIDHLIMVADGTYIAGVPGIFRMFADECARGRYLFLNPLVSAHPEKVHVFTLRNYGSEYKVHSKVVIIDDIFATIGSANVCRRSFTHDSELNAFVLDGRVEEGARKFARDLRIFLWAEHLGWHHNFEMARNILADVDRAVKYLTTKRPSSARLRPYDLNWGKTASYPRYWDTIVDPDGSTRVESAECKKKSKNPFLLAVTKLRKYLMKLLRM